MKFDRYFIRTHFFLGSLPQRCRTQKLKSDRPYRVTLLYIIYWTSIRAIREFSKSPDKSKQESDKLLLYALDAAKYALELDPDHWAANKWYGILLGDTADIEGIQKLLECSEAIKFHFEKSIENFKDPTTIYCLGMWHFRFTDLPWHRRKLAALYFGVKIPDSTYEDALRKILLNISNLLLYLSQEAKRLCCAYMRTSSLRKIWAKPTFLN